MARTCPETGYVGADCSSDRINRLPTGRAIRSTTSADANSEIDRRAALACGWPGKMSKPQIALARELVHEGKSISGMATTFNVPPAAIYRCLGEEQGQRQAGRASQPHDPSMAPISNSREIAQRAYPSRNRAAGEPGTASLSQRRASS